MLRFSINFNLCIAIEVILACAICACIALELDLAVSLMLAVSFLIAFGYAALNATKNTSSLPVFVLVLLCTFHVLFNGLVENGQLGFDYFKKLIMFLTFVLLLNFAGKYSEEISEGVRKLIKILPLCAGLFLVISYFFMGNTAKMADGITLNFTNPNFTAMWLLHFFLFGVLFLIDSQWDIRLRLLYVPVIAALLWLIFMTKSRACLVGAAVFLVLILGYKLKMRMGRKMVLLIAVFPMLLVIFYLAFVNQDWFTDIFSFLVSKGKPLTSRTSIWSEGLKSFWQHPITGNYAGISNGTGMSQMHNTHLDILCSYGIVPLVLFVRILYTGMKSGYSRIETFYQYTAFSAFFVIILAGSFEAVIVSGAVGLNYLTVALLLLTFPNRYAENSLVNT